ncbi:hypothetical protein QYE76_016669 [Lolium multiflorum]|uniref:CCHC-type domain-containing protein n=1 Tax=Lolium multiflorum TaxID=4521 RepID=A0AAD8PMF3_LOLMU|nr:hypothetical protein QYE76_016669 [Lolium multiflorum]
MAPTSSYAYGLRCYKCKQQGHLPRECPNLLCEVCKAKGHVAWQCTTPSAKKLYFDELNAQVSKMPPLEDDLGGDGVEHGEHGILPSPTEAHGVEMVEHGIFPSTTEAHGDEQVEPTPICLIDELVPTPCEHESHLAHLSESDSELSDFHPICEFECFHLEDMSDTQSELREVDDRSMEDIAFANTLTSPSLVSSYVALGSTEDEFPLMEKMYMVHEDDDISPCLLQDGHVDHMDPPTSTTPTSNESAYKGTRTTTSTATEHDLTKRAIESYPIKDLTRGNHTKGNSTTSTEGREDAMEARGRKADVTEAWKRRRKRSWTLQAGTSAPDGRNFRPTGTSAPKDRNFRPDAAKMPSSAQRNGSGRNFRPEGPELPPTRNFRPSLEAEVSESTADVEEHVELDTDYGSASIIDMTDIEELYTDYGSASIANMDDIDELYIDTCSTSMDDMVEHHHEDDIDPTIVPNMFGIDTLLRAPQGATMRVLMHKIIDLKYIIWSIKSVPHMIVIDTLLRAHQGAASNMPSRMSHHLGMARTVIDSHHLMIVVNHYHLMVYIDIRHHMSFAATSHFMIAIDQHLPRIFDDTHQDMVMRQEDESLDMKATNTIIGCLPLQGWSLDMKTFLIRRLLSLVPPPQWPLPRHMPMDSDATSASNKATLHGNVPISYVSAKKLYFDELQGQATKKPTAPTLQDEDLQGHRKDEVDPSLALHDTTAPPLEDDLGGDGVEMVEHGKFPSTKEAHEDEKVEPTDEV